MGSRSSLRLVAIAAVAVLVVGCGSGGPAAQSPGTSAGASAAASAPPNFNESTTLTIRTEGPWATFDPSKGGNLPSIQVSAGLYDRLIDMAPDGKVIPYLATSWDQTPTSVKFTLRKDVTCSDGTPLTASAVAKSFDDRLGISDPKTKSPSVLGEFGAGPFKVSADDAAGTFTLELGSPFSETLTGFAVGNDGFVICPKGLPATPNLDTAAFGTGPYKIDQQDRPNSLTLKLRTDWKWGPGGRDLKGLPGTIVYKNIPSDTTAANLLVTGGLDIARIGGIDVKRLAADNSLGKLVKTPLYTNPVWLNFNPGHPTADIKIREAIVTAISADDYNQAAYGGLGEVTTSLFSKNAPCYEPSTAQLIPATDVNKAKQVLLSAGFTESGGKIMKDGKPVVLQVVGDVIQGSGPEYIQSQLAKVGFTLDFTVQEHTVYSSNFLQPGKFDVIVPGIASDILGQYITSYFGADPPAGRNFSRFHDAAVEAQITKALQKPPAEACADWKAIQVTWQKNFYFRPLSAQNFYWFYKNPKWSFTANTSVLFPQSLK